MEGAGEKVAAACCWTVGRYDERAANRAGAIRSHRLVRPVRHRARVPFPQEDRLLPFEGFDSQAAGDL